MSNPCLLHLPLRSDLVGRDRSGSVSATASGPVRFTADGYYAEEGTTNRCSNPAAAIDLTGDAAIGTAVETRDTAVAYLGPASRKVVALAADDGFRTHNTEIAAVSGETWTVSAYVRGAGTINAKVQGHSNVGSTLIGEVSVQAIALTDQWQRVTITRTLNQASTAYVAARFQAQAATTFWVANIQIEKKAYATSYCDGSLGTGYSWAGTAHASASSRAEAKVSRDIGAVPASYALRYTPAGGATQMAYLTGPGAIGSYGALALVGTTMTLTSTRGTAYRDVMAFDRVLTAQERATLAATPEWSFGVLQPRIGGALRISNGIGLAISSVAAPATIAIARAAGGLS